MDSVKTLLLCLVALERDRGYNGEGSLPSLPIEILRSRILVQSGLIKPLYLSDAIDMNPSCLYERNRLAFLFDIPSYLDLTIFPGKDDFPDFIRKEIPRDRRVSSTMKIAIVSIMLVEELRLHPNPYVGRNHLSFLRSIVEDDDIKLTEFVLSFSQILVYTMGVAPRITKVSSEEGKLISLAICNNSVRMLELIASKLNHSYKPDKLDGRTLERMVRRPELYSVLMNNDLRYCPELLHLMIKEDDIEGVRYLLSICTEHEAYFINSMQIGRVCIYTHAIIFRRTKLLKMLIAHYRPSDEEIERARVIAKKRKHNHGAS